MRWGEWPFLDHFDWLNVPFGKITGPRACARGAGELRVRAIIKDDYKRKKSDENGCAKDMIIWLYITILSAFTGLICSVFLKGRIGVICSGVIPWLGLLAWLLYQEYFVPYKGGGASMWPVAQLFAGTIAAAIGIISYKLTVHIKTNGDKSGKAL